MKATTMQWLKIRMTHTQVQRPESRELLFCVCVCGCHWVCVCVCIDPESCAKTHKNSFSFDSTQQWSHFSTTGKKLKWREWKKNWNSCLKPTKKVFLSFYFLALGWCWWWSSLSSSSRPLHHHSCTLYLNIKDDFFVSTK